MSKPHCIRCLLREIGEKDKLASVESYKATVKEEDRAPESLYEERLSICKDCKYLSYGTCTKSGFYVEARAYKVTEHCPCGTLMW